MVTFVAAGEDGRMLLGIGLAEENVERLKTGAPAKIRLVEIDGLKGIDASKLVVMIFYGKTIEEIHENLKQFIDGNTRVVDRRRDN